MPNPIYGQHEENTLQQFHDVMQNAERGALMADGHLGYIMPIGGVAAYKDVISPCAVGFDIACGNKAVELDCMADEIKPKLDLILDSIQENISFGVGRKNNTNVDDPLFEFREWDVYDPNIRGNLKKLAQDQLGTVGSGNHYVDIFEDENGKAWVGVHFGSRGFGHKTCTGFLNLAVNGKWDERAKEQEVLLGIYSDLGERYYRAMKLAGRYAYAGRNWVAQTVADIIGASVVSEVHNHHNYAWEEEHNGEEYVVIRKGATPAFPGQKGFIGGSMGDNAVIVEGIDGQKSKEALYSTVHGAGRVMGRREAAGRMKWKRLEEGKPKQLVKVSEGKISRKMMEEWLLKEGVKLRGGGTDESPHVYRRLNDVLAEHEGTIKVLHTLKPLGVVMAGENEFDPYKD